MKCFFLVSLVASVAFTLLADVRTTLSAAASSEAGIEAQLAKVEKRVAAIAASMPGAGGEKKGKSDDKDNLATDDDAAIHAKRKSGAAKWKSHKTVHEKRNKDGTVTRSLGSAHISGEVCGSDDTCIGILTDVLHAFKTNKAIKSTLTAYGKPPADLDKLLGAVINESAIGKKDIHTLKMPGKSWNITVQNVKGPRGKFYKLSDLKVGELYDANWDGDKQVLTTSFTTSPSKNVDIIVKAGAVEEAPAEATTEESDE